MMKKLVVFLLLMLINPTVLASYPSPDVPCIMRERAAYLPDGCVLNMYMDAEQEIPSGEQTIRRIFDESGNGNHAEIREVIPEKGGNFEKLVDSTFGTRYSIKYGTGAVLLPSDTLQTRNEYTVDIWVDVHRSNDNQQFLIFRGNSNGTEPLYELSLKFWQSSTGLKITERTAVEINGAKKLVTTTNSNGDNDNPSSKTNSTDRKSTWIHITLAHKDGHSKIYVNGVNWPVSRTETNINYDLESADKLYYLGTSPVTTGYPATVRHIGSVKIFDRCLESDEVKARYGNDLYRLMSHESQLETATVDGKKLNNSDFVLGDDGVYRYEYITRQPKNVAVTAVSSNASFKIIQADDVPGKAIITVTAQDGVEKSIYEVVFIEYRGTDDFSIGELFLEEKDGKVTASVDIMKTSSAIGRYITLILQLHDEKGRRVDISYDMCNDLTSGSSDNLSVELEIPHGIEGYATAYIWDDLNNILPLCQDETTLGEGSE